MRWTHDRTRDHRGPWPLEPRCASGQQHRLRFSSAAPPGDRPAAAAALRSICAKLAGGEVSRTEGVDLEPVADDVNRHRAWRERDGVCEQGLAQIGPRRGFHRGRELDRSRGVEPTIRDHAAILALHDLDEKPAAIDQQLHDADGKERRRDR